MPTYTTDVYLTLTNIHVEADNEKDAIEQIEYSIRDWTDGYLPLDPDGFGFDYMDLVREGRSNNRKPAPKKSGSGCKSKPKSKPKASNARKPAPKRKSSQPRKANGQFAKSKGARR